MDGRIAVKLQDDKSGLAGTWYDRIQNSFYHASQPISMKNSCKKNYSGKEVGRKDGNKDENIFTGSLAEVYEKALTNVLNIQPNFKMEDSHVEKKANFDKKLTEVPDKQHFIPQEHSIHGTFRHPHFRSSDTNLSQHQNNMFEAKKLNATNKSAFHVPEKRRPTNGLSRHSNWSHDHPLPYPINYPGDYYPMIHPPTFYSRGSPYHNAFIERMNFYPGPQSREYPAFTHVLPWTPFERDYKPWASRRYHEWSPKGTPGREMEDTKKASHDKTFDKSTGNEDRLLVPSRSCIHNEKTADKQKVRSTNPSSDFAPDEITKFEKNKLEKISSHLDSNVKTRRMRAFERRNEFGYENKKDTFESPKEEFLFRLGLTRVH